MDSQQQFCLKWNSFGSNLASSFGNLFKSENLADVTLFCEGVSFRAHRLILAACSKHFQDIFEMTPVAPMTVLVVMDGTSSSNMSALLEFMYKGEVHISQECLSSFLKAAETLQVKGLSIEHEKLAVVHGSKHIGQVGEDCSLDSPTGRKPKLEGSQSSSSEQQPPPPQPMHPQHHAPTSSASSSYASILSPYPLHYRPYEQRVPASAPPATASGSQSQLYENYARKRHHRSSSEAPPPDAVRASVLRDGSKSREAAERASMPLGYRPGGGLSPASEPDGKGEEKGYHLRYEGGPGPGSSGEPRDAREGPGGSSVGNPGSAGSVPFDRTAAVDVESGSQAKPESRRSSVDPGSNCPEDLRVKLEFSSGSHSEEQHGNAAPYTEPAVETAAPESLPANVWNSGTSIKMSPHKGGPVATTDGKKLQCPFCERLYGYETNLRAHIRQRHQGIRVPCPYCNRTFTRNNTVRRHIAREHKAEYALKVYHPPPTEVHNLSNQ